MILSNNWLLFGKKKKKKEQPTDAAPFESVKLRTDETWPKAGSSVP